MNKTYRNVWNAATNTWTAAAETAKGRTKGSARAARKALFALAAGGAVLMLSNTASAGYNAGGGTSMPGEPNGVAIGCGDATAGGAIVLGGDCNVAAGRSRAEGGTSMALGYNAQVLGSGSDSSVALGASTRVNNAANAVALGSGASVSANSAMALGSGASASSNSSVALGSGSLANRANSVSIGAAGSERQLTNLAAGVVATDAVNVGQMNTALSTKVDTAYTKVNGATAAAANGAGAIAIGDNALANSTGSAYSTIAIGRNAVAQINSTALGADAQVDTRGVAVGGNTRAMGDRSTAMGYQAQANGAESTAVGSAAAATGTQSVAIGRSATAANNGSVALGYQSTTDRDNVVSVGSATQQRQITNVAAGTMANDAVNISQLTPVVTALGGGAKINADGSITGPSYNLANGTGTPATSIADAFGQLDGALTTTNGKVGDLETKLGSGTIGLVQQAGAAQKLTVGKDTDGTAVDFTNNASTSRTLTGVAAGAVAAGSTEAINGSQLHAVSTSVADAIGAGSSVNPDGSITVPSFTVGDGKGGTKVVHNVGDVVTNLDGRTTTNETSITTINSQLKDLSSGTIGLVQQTSAGADLTVGAATDGAAVNFAGTAGARKLTGIVDGDLSTTSTEAVNGAQLNATNTNVTNLDNRVTGIDGRVTTAETNITNLQTAVGSGAIGLVQQATPTGDITVASGSGGTAVNFAGTDGVRVLSGIGAGIGNNDAVSVGQLKSVIGYNIVDPLDPLMATRYDDASMKSVTFGGDPLFGTVLNNVAPGLIASGSMQAVNGGQLFDMQAKYDGLIGALDGRVGAIEAGGIGGPGTGTPEGSVPSPGKGDGSTAVGAGSDASGKNSSAIGNGAVASGSGSSAVGNGAVASGENSTALGQGAQASNNNSVAIGAGSTTSRDNEVSFGSAGNERILANVADGVRDTDAVNVRQMNNAIGGLNNKIDSNHRDAMGGVAAAMAVAGLPTSSAPGKTFMAISGSTYGGEQGTAIGASYMSQNGKWVVKGAMNTSSRGEVGAVVGGGFYW